MEYVIKQGELVLNGCRNYDGIDKKTGKFLKGHISHNKGIKGVRNSPATEFKKGNEPHNTKHDGYISIRIHRRDNAKYKYIRISKGKWQLLNRYVWEQNNGPIPKGMIIRHIDGDSMNCQISNLKLISRAENLSLNYDREKMTEGIKEAWRRDRIRHKYGMPLRTKLLNRQIKNQKI